MWRRKNRTLGDQQIEDLRPWGWGHHLFELAWAVELGDLMALGPDDVGLLCVWDLKSLGANGGGARGNPAASGIGGGLRGNPAASGIGGIRTNIPTPPHPNPTQRHPTPPTPPHPTPP